MSAPSNRKRALVDDIVDVSSEEEGPKPLGAPASWRAPPLRPVVSRSVEELLRQHTANNNIANVNNSADLHIDHGQRQASPGVSAPGPALHRAHNAPVAATRPPQNLLGAAGGAIASNSSGHHAGPSIYAEQQPPAAIALVGRGTQIEHSIAPPARPVSVPTTRSTRNPHDVGSGSYSFRLSDFPDIPPSSSSSAQQRPLAGASQSVALSVAPSLAGTSILSSGFGSFGFGNMQTGFGGTALGGGAVVGGNRNTFSGLPGNTSTPTGFGFAGGSSTVPASVVSTNDFGGGFGFGSASFSAHIVQGAGSAPSRAQQGFGGPAQPESVASHHPKKRRSSGKRFFPGGAGSASAGSVAELQAQLNATSSVQLSGAQGHLQENQQLVQHDQHSSAQERQGLKIVSSPQTNSNAIAQLPPIVTDEQEAPAATGEQQLGFTTLSGTVIGGGYANSNAWISGGEYMRTKSARMKEQYLKFTSDRMGLIPNADEEAILGRERRERTHGGDVVGRAGINQIVPAVENNKVVTSYQEGTEQQDEKKEDLVFNAAGKQAEAGEHSYTSTIFDSRGIYMKVRTERMKEQQRAAAAASAGVIGAAAQQGMPSDMAAPGPNKPLTLVDSNAAQKGACLEDIVRKLATFELRRPQRSGGAQLFSGLTFWMTGRTSRLTDMQIRKMILQHGGVFEPYGMTRVTHIIAENLAMGNQVWREYKEKREKKRYKVVLPTWLEDCIAQKRLLPESEYLPEVLRGGARIASAADRLAELEKRRNEMKAAKKAKAGQHANEQKQRQDGAQLAGEKKSPLSSEKKVLDRNYKQPKVKERGKNKSTTQSSQEVSASQRRAKRRAEKMAAKKKATRLGGEAVDDDDDDDPLAGLTQENIFWLEQLEQRTTWVTIEDLPKSETERYELLRPYESKWHCLQTAQLVLADSGKLLTIPGNVGAAGNLRDFLRPGSRNGSVGDCSDIAKLQLAFVSEDIENNASEKNDIVEMNQAKLSNASCPIYAEENEVETMNSELLRRSSISNPKKGMSALALMQAAAARIPLGKKVDSLGRPLTSSGAAAGQLGSSPDDDANQTSRMGAATRRRSAVDDVFALAQREILKARDAEGTRRSAAAAADWKILEKMVNRHKSAVVGQEGIPSTASDVVGALVRSNDTSLIREAVQAVVAVEVDQVAHKTKELVAGRDEKERNSLHNKVTRTGG
ncbi:unnamed protein product [Amoebophrya sp. A25]|nr:unnamed protein product [Amoebophrya sp. A25]|eukprot:GSA25T00009921001.1